MSQLDKQATIGVLGAGTMGTGIAQLAATSGHPVILSDLAPTALAKARSTIESTFARLVDKGRLDAAGAGATLARIQFVAALEPLAPCGLVIEAILEDLSIKRDVFKRLEAAIPITAMLATNTSSLSIASIGAALTHPERFLGLHFFNPAPVMPLVEVIPGVATQASSVSVARELVESWGKTAVLAKDTPGFIVNRIARPFYGEALRILDEGVADCATIDWAMRELGRFRMGPFELMDFIGHDVNFVVTRTVFEAMFGDPRFRPSLTQQRLLEAGRLGRKSGQGFYDYRPEAVPPQPQEDRQLGRAIVDRIVAMIINEASDALLFGVASARDIDLALTLGVNYPKGPLAWANEWGVAQVFSQLERLHEEYGEDRYRISPLLRRLAREEGRFDV